MNNNVQETFDKGAKNLLEYSIEMAMLQRTRAAGILLNVSVMKSSAALKNTIMLPQIFWLTSEVCNRIINKRKDKWNTQ